MCHCSHQSPLEGAYNGITCHIQALLLCPSFDTAISSSAAYTHASRPAIISTDEAESGTPISRSSTTGPYTSSTTDCSATSQIQTSEDDFCITKQTESFRSWQPNTRLSSCGPATGKYGSATYAVACTPTAISRYCHNFRISRQHSVQDKPFCSSRPAISISFCACGPVTASNPFNRRLSAVYATRRKSIIPHGAIQHVWWKSEDPFCSGCSLRYGKVDTFLAILAIPVCMQYTIMSWEFQNFYQIMDIKTSAAPFSNLTFGFDMIISELPP